MGNVGCKIIKDFKRPDRKFVELFKGMPVANIDDCMNHNVSLSSEDAEFIDFILENYLKYSGAELERLSHNEMPWIKTRGDLNVNERCDKVITPELMIEYYGKKWETIKS